MGRNFDWSKLKYNGKQMDYEYDKQQTAYDRERARAIRNTTMPFGKFQGKRFNNIPLNYLQWCIKTFKPQPNNQRLLAGIRTEIEKRTKINEGI